jgi:hypothetical protein
MQPAELSDDLTFGVVLDCLRGFPFVRLTVTGACMAPALPAGATVAVQHADERPPRFGDVVLLRDGQGLRLHRLVWKPLLGGGGCWRTKADRARGLDPAVRREDVLGTVVAVNGRCPARLRPGLVSLAGAMGARLRRGRERP